MNYTLQPQQPDDVIVCSSPAQHDNNSDDKEAMSTGQGKRLQGCSVGYTVACRFVDLFVWATFPFIQRFSWI